MKTLNDFDFNGKKVLVRVDFNVPLDDEFQITDNTRIEAAKPTVIKILEDGGSVILMSHLGRPKSREEAFSMKHILEGVSDVMGVQTKFAPDCVGKEAKEAARDLQEGEILLLENLRYHKEETDGDKEFAEQLASLGDFYVNDAFGTAHRAHASTAVIAGFFSENKCAGCLMEKEITSVKRVLEDNQKPVTAILGGAKVSSKITIIENILDKIDHLIIGGGMTFTFIKAKGGQTGNSLVEEDKMKLALSILKQAEEKGVKVHLPVDAVIAKSFSETSDTQEVNIDEIPDGWMGLDVGPQTNLAFEDIIKQSKTILWNGPVGVFEMETFAVGTIALGNAIADATEHGAFSLVGGGDSVAAVKKFGFEDKVSYVSTGGGAMLEMLEGKNLPGVAAIES